MEILQTRSLTKRYGDFTALNGVSLTLRRGDIYGLVGRNGAGKTTFFKCVMGLAKPSGGKIEICGESADPGRARKQIGFMTSPAFFPYLTPKANLEYLRRVKGVAAADETDRLLKLVGLDGADKPAGTFSMGMKQRLGIAGALLGSPPIVALDEPINGLDPQGIADIRAVVRDARDRRGVTFIISSHILSELDLIATRFGFIESGELLGEISREELHERAQRSLLVEVDDAAKARSVLQIALGAAVEEAGGRRLTLLSHLDEPNAVVRALVNGGVDVYEIRRRETTLEEYFMKLVGGADD
ncbi:MAG: ABC transporter ATP-binding protein [Oscillospiraceae bacterium]|jgi:ABC-2 type transport system ATP-binding protein|nr:ABC transporter ATP-binding protein [Oscillospiraceae bacterium]